jgi:transposase
MGQIFEPYEPEQALLFPPSVSDWLPEGHLARFVSDTVDELDLGPFLKKFRQRKNDRGQLAYHPRMMLKVLIFAYSQGIFSSRKIAAGIDDLVALRYLAAGNGPSHRTMARFRQENIEHFQDLFVQVVQVAMEAGLVKMGTLAIDGSKVKANASKHKSMSYGRMKSEECRLSGEIKRITGIAQDIDEAEDEEFGPDFRGDELPEELRTRKARRAKIREAIKALEGAQAKEDEESGHGKQQQKSGKGRPRRPNGVPPDKKQRSFTDPDSRIMGSPQKGFLQGYNGQIAVDAKEQIVVAQGITQCAADNDELIPMLEQAEENTGQLPKKALADAGYKSEANFQALEDMGVDGHVSLGRGESDPEVPDQAKPATKRMHRKRRTKRSRKIYKQRKAIVEPVFGWIKSVLGFRSFSMRGLEKVSGEWSLVCLALNLKRMGTKLEWAP